MKRRANWTYLLKTENGRRVLWFTVALSAASLVAVGITFSLEGGRPGKHIDGSELKALEDFADRSRNTALVPSTYFANRTINSNENHFLVLKGIDTAESACEYYRAIGAIQERCGNLILGGQGFFFRSGDNIPVGIKLDCSPLRGSTTPCVDWKELNGLNNPNHVRVAYFNAVDLGFGRAMHGTTFTILGVKNTAYYVCNYPSLSEAIDGLVTDQGAVACVAFDYSSARGFTRLYVFKPFGRINGRDLFALAASAALDNAGEKFVPGLCKACHGSNGHHDGPPNPFPGSFDNGATGNVGVKFLPFDLDGFDYGVNDFSRSAQEGKFKQLNQMILNTDATRTVRELIEGWYRDNRIEQDKQDSQFIPSGWKGPGQQLYRNVVKPFCRTCHVAMFEKFADFASFDEFNRQKDAVATFVCSPSVGSGTATSPERKMPHAAVTFDQFWLNRAAIAVLSRFLERPCPPPPP